MEENKKNINQIQHLLNKKKKSISDCDIIIDHFKNIIFFQEFIKLNESYVLHEIIQSMEISYKKKHEVVFYKGDKPDYLYIIWDGKVSLYNDFPFEDIKLIRENPDLIDSHNKIFNQEFVNFHKKNKKIYNKIWNIILLKKINYEMKRGVFGEIGVREKTLRKLSIICDQDCVFGLISSNTYMDILQVRENKEHKKKLSYFFDIFKYFLNNEETKFIVNYFEKNKILKRWYLFKQNMVFDKIFFIKKGSTILSENIIIDKINYSNNQVEDLNLKKITLFKLKNICSINMNKFYKEQKIIELNGFNIFGLDEFYKNSKNYEYNLKINSDCSYYYIDKDNFTELVNKYISFKKFIENYFKNKFKLILNLNKSKFWSKYHQSIDFEKLKFFKKPSNFTNYLSKNQMSKKIKNNNELKALNVKNQIKINEKSKIKLKNYDIIIKNYKKKMLCEKYYNTTRKTCDYLTKRPNNSQRINKTRETSIKFIKNKSKNHLLKNLKINYKFYNKMKKTEDFKITSNSQDIYINIKNNIKKHWDSVNLKECLNAKSIR